MFKVDDKVVYPMHGAGVIDKIEEKEIMGTTKAYYIMHLPIGDLSVMIPTDSETNAGLRPIVTKSRAEEVIKSLAGEPEECNQNWNKRYRENMLKLKSGDISEVAGVVKTLILRDRERGLSTGERKMLVSAKQIFISELVLSTGMIREEIEEKIENIIFNA